jgi:uncharacterized protein (TIGR02001 family)
LAVAGGLVARLLLMIAPLAATSAVRAQVAASATLSSSYVYRGVAISDGQPTLGANLSYDGDQGLYAAATAIIEAAPHAGLRWLGHVETAGYAFTLRSGPTVDLGVSNLGYTITRYGGAQVDSPEAFAGVLNGPVNVYLHLSPDGLGGGGRTLYGEANGALKLRAHFRLFAHAGLLGSLGGGHETRPRYDLRLGAAATFRGVEAQLSWVLLRPDTYYSGAAGGRNGMAVASVTFGF